VDEGIERVRFLSGWPRGIDAVTLVGRATAAEEVSVRLV
jgi:hypothetical protein